MCEDVESPDPCPSCGSRYHVILRCDACPLLQLEHIRATSPTGGLLDRVLELDFDTAKFSVDWSTIPEDEALGLKILDQERRKWESEERVRQKEEFDLEQRMQAQRRQ